MLRRVKIRFDSHCVTGVWPDEMEENDADEANEVVTANVARIWI